MSLSRFVLISTVFHLLLFAVVFLTMNRQKPELKDQGIIARLITPREFAKPEKKKPVPLVPLPKPQPAIKIPQKPKHFNDTEPPNTMRHVYEPPRAAPSPPSKPETAPRANEPGAQGPKGGGTALPEEKKGPGPADSSKFGKRPGIPDLKDELFDKDVINQQIAKSAGPHLPSPKDIISFSTKEFRYIGYLERLKDKIEGIWVYPRAAAEKGIYGDLVIRFTIKRDGSLADVQVMRTSGHSILDEAAVKALKDSQPYWPLPKEWKEDTFTIDGHFVYSLSGYFIK